MKVLGKDLVFISQINRDGSGTHKVAEDYLRMMQEELFKVRCLSLSENTYIATNFNSFVVKMKEYDVEPSSMEKAWEEYNIAIGRSIKIEWDDKLTWESSWNAAQLHFTQLDKYKTP